MHSWRKKKQQKERRKKVKSVRVKQHKQCIYLMSDDDDDGLAVIKNGMARSNREQTQKYIALHRFSSGFTVLRRIQTWR